jgi:hypothetical protein
MSVKLYRNARPARDQGDEERRLSWKNSRMGFLLTVDVRFHTGIVQACQYTADDLYGKEEGKTWWRRGE